MDERERELRARRYRPPPDEPPAAPSVDSPAVERQRHPRDVPVASSKSGTHARPVLVADPAARSRACCSTNAGMNQFIPYFLGQAEPPLPARRPCQKCFRANDIENVGHTARHLTMFEMLGQLLVRRLLQGESCAWALELVTEGFGIDHDRLWMTVYEDDDEAVDIWNEPRDRPPERLRAARGKAATTTGRRTPPAPADRASEIFVDRGSTLRPRRRPRRRRGPLLRDLEPRVHAGPGRRRSARCSAICRTRTSTPARRSSVSPWCCRTRASFFETDLFAPLLEEVRVPVGQALRRRRAATMSRSGSSASTRARRRS